MRSFLRSFRNAFTAQASDNLAASKVALDTLNVSFFLAEGSLLGWYRNCMPIPWDTDLDLVRRHPSHSAPSSHTTYYF